MIAEMEPYAYVISARDIEWYRSLAPYMTVERFDYLNMDDDNHEIDDLRKQLLAGRIDAATFLRELDRKVRMRAPEGN